MKHKILIVTGGGDCPGLNAVIRSVFICAKKENWSVFGSYNAFNGLLAEPTDLIELTESNTKGIHSIGGTIIGTTNKGVPSKFPIKKKDGSIELVDRTNELVEKFFANGFTVLINIGGDGSQKISVDLAKKGINVIGIPKTIDNDLPYTDFTFGFQTAVSIATDALDKLTTTAASHQRIMILEVMGRDAGWIALNSGIAGGADVLLIPECPFDINKIAHFLNSKLKSAREFAIIVVAEGAYSKNGATVSKYEQVIGSAHKRLGGIGDYLMENLKSKVDREIRVSVLGHLQRGGSPIAFDRIIAAEFGVKAIELIKQEQYGMLTVYQYPDLLAVPLTEVIKQNKQVDMNSFLVQTAKSLGIYFGDDL